MHKILLIVIAVLIITIGGRPASAEMQRETAHTPFPVSATRVKAATATPYVTVIDKEALVDAVYAALKYDSSKLTRETVQPLVYIVAIESEKQGVDPLDAVTIIFIESRWTIGAVGDGGRACGMAQQHARFSSKWSVSSTPNISKECTRLKNPIYAARVLAFHLKYIKTKSSRYRGSYKQHIWWYNGRQRYQDKYEMWREAIRRAYVISVKRRKNDEKRENT